MPKMDGYTMIRTVRGDATVRMVPAVFVSTEADERDAVRAYEAGANFYLVKPVMPVELAEVARLMTGMGPP
jgi:two-component system chemotaxis response regulator CheY